MVHSAIWKRHGMAPVIEKGDMEIIREGSWTSWAVTTMQASACASRMLIRMS